MQPRLGAAALLRAGRRCSASRGAAGVSSSSSSRAFSRGAAPPEELERRFLLGNYSSDGVRFRPGLAFTHGTGSTLHGTDGRAYVDWAAGIAVNALGHADAEVTAAVAAQAALLTHTSNLFHTWAPLELAAALVESSAHLDKVFFCNSGTEANEAALKFARKASLLRASERKAAKLAAAGAPPAPAFAPGCKATPPSRCLTQGGVCGCWPQVADGDLAAEHKTEFVAFKGSFHGRSMGALAVTHKPQIRQPFGPYPGDVKYARFNNLDDARLAVSSKTAAIIVEPVQGEGGVYAATPDFMRGLRALADAHGALLIVDEVQCGLGRTGRLWAHEAFGAEAAPDMMTVAKPLANGLPIGAVLMTDAVARTIAPGDHGTTFGGGPLVARAAQVVLARVAAPAFLAASRARGAQLRAGLEALRARHPSAIAEVRGAPDGGLFVGVQLTASPKRLTTRAGDKGLIVITAGENTLRICPPLNISEADIAFGLRVLGESLDELAAEDAAQLKA